MNTDVFHRDILHPRLKKEVRALALPWIISLLAGPVLVVISHMRGFSPSLDDWGGLCVVQLFAFNLLCASIFGQEFSAGTMESYLSQPVKRLRLWREKIGVASAMLVACLVWDCMLAAIIYFPDLYPHNLDEFAFPLIIAVIAICTAPLVSLKSKKTIAGMIGAIVFPCVVLLLVFTIRMWVFPSKHPVIVDRTFGPASLIVWCVLAYWLGRRTFLRLEV